MDLFGRELTRRFFTGFVTPSSISYNGIFVFGSNTEGRHGLGNAKFAKDNFGAINRQASGLQGRSYGLITTDLSIKAQGGRLSKERVIKEIQKLYDFARGRQDLDFYIGYRMEGRLLSGFSHKELGEMFYDEDIPLNIIFEEKFWNEAVAINGEYPAG